MLCVALYGQQMLVHPLMPALLPFATVQRRVGIRTFCSSKPALSITRSSEELLDRFWQAISCLPSPPGPACPGKALYKNSLPACRRGELWTQDSGRD